MLSSLCKAFVQNTVLIQNEIADKLPNTTRPKYKAAYAFILQLFVQ